MMIRCQAWWAWTDDYTKRSRRWWANFFFHLMLALDDFVQAWQPDGVIGITISSRTGTAADHGHRWGIVGDRLLNTCWPFGPDKETGDTHCTSAIKNDCLRSVAAIKALLGDDVVVNKRSLHAFKQQILSEVRLILEE